VQGIHHLNPFPPPSGNTRVENHVSYRLLWIYISRNPAFSLGMPQPRHREGDVVFATKRGLEAFGNARAGNGPGQPSKEEKQAAVQEVHHSPLRIFLRPKILFHIFRATVSEWNADNVQRMGAALAYYTIFSLAPLLVISIAIAALVFGEKAAQGEMLAQIQGFIGRDNAKAIQTMIQSAQKPAHGTIAAILGLGVLLWGASSVFTEMHDALNMIWDVDLNAQSGIWSLVKARFLGFGMVLAIGFLLLVSLLLSAATSGLAEYIEARLAVPVALFHVLDLIVSMLVITALFAMIFKILPDLKIAWNDVWVGAVLTAILFAAGKFAIGFYIGKSVSASAYGAAASLVIVVMWIYYSALILYFGAEFTHIFANEFGSHADEQNWRNRNPASGGR
jgi:membrane protein